MQKDFNSVWENCLQVIKDNVSLQSYKTWFEPIKPIKLKSKVLTIQVPSQFFYEWLEEHYVDILKKTIRKELGAEGRLEYSIIMENSQNGTKPYTVKIPGTNRQAIKNSPVSMPIDLNKDKSIRNPFIIPGLK
ncbi:MAG: DnaA N-terminal domain-containing protein, partial [Vicingaceae bacterium]